MSRQSTTLATTTRSTQMLRLTTCTPGIRWLQHCFLQEREPSASLFQAFTHKEKACFNVHSQFLASKEKPVTGCHKKRKSNQELENCQIRIILERQGNNCPQKQNPRSWNMKTERILPKIRFCELKRQTDSSSSGNWAYSNKVWTVQTRTSSTSPRSGRSRTSTSWYSY